MVTMHSAAAKGNKNNQPVRKKNNNEFLMKIKTETTIAINMCGSEVQESIVQDKAVRFRRSSVTMLCVLCVENIFLSTHQLV